MTRPTLQVRIALAAAPLDAASSIVWTDITSWVRVDSAAGGQPIQIGRGRQFELDQIEAGECRFTLDNRDRRFDPDYAAGPYAPNITPAKRLNVRAQWAGVWYDLFTGYVERWVPRYPTFGDALVEVVAVDALALLGKIPVTMTKLLSNNPVNVIQDVLNNVPWPAADRSTGVNSPTQIPAQTWTRQPALAIIQQVAAADGGVFYVEDTGATCYHDRYYTARNSASQATFGDGAGELPYEDIVWSYDDTRIYNHAEVTRAGGTLQVADDAASQASYGTRPAPALTSLQITTDTEALARAQYTVAQYALPRLRAQELILNGDLDPAGGVWVQLLSRTLDDKVTVVRRPPGGGSAIQKTVRIGALRVSIGLDAWRVSWQLYPDAGQWWVVQDVVNGVLDSTTRAAY